ncbi:MAG: 4Fe-4S binding protein [Saprospiraceae bacterium]
MRKLFTEAGKTATVNSLLHEAIDNYVQTNQNGNGLAQEFEWFKEELGILNLPLPVLIMNCTRKTKRAAVGLFSITINPTTCKGCMECVEVCDDDALRVVTQTDDSITRLRKEWGLWTDLPNTLRNSTALTASKRRLAYRWKRCCSTKMPIYSLPAAMGLV